MNNKNWAAKGSGVASWQTGVPRGTLNVALITKIISGTGYLIPVGRAMAVAGGIFPQRFYR